MKRYRALPPALVLLTAALPWSPVFGCGMEAHRIVARLVADALPAPLRASFSSRTDGLIERAVEPGGAWRARPSYRAREQWHYIMLDAAAEDPLHQRRMQAALAFPADESAARNLYRQHGVMLGGQLVWRLADLTDDLAGAFGGGESDAIVEAAGHVIHFSTDACNPFCTTRNRRGTESGNVCFGDFPPGEPLFAHQDVAQRIVWELIRRNAERYRDSIDAGSVRFEISVDVPSMVLESTVAALDRHEALCLADAEILRKMGVTDAAGFLARADEYYLLLDQRCGEHVVDQLRHAVRLAVTLIVGAWTKAGSPELIEPPAPVGVAEAEAAPAGREQPPPQQAEGEKADQPKAAGECVASKNSKVYHRPDCRHVARISADNLERFANPEEAAASGRRPCRTCYADDG